MEALQSDHGLGEASAEFLAIGGIAEVGGIEIIGQHKAEFGSHCDAVGVGGADL
jgi:hypothetical protein